MNESELLFTDILRCERLDLYLHKDMRLSQPAAKRVSRVFKRRLAGEPFEYILGRAEFMGMGFKVTEDVLIPRPETEILVEKAVVFSRGLRLKGYRVKILDIGTGSGNIAVSMGKLLPLSRICAIDVSGNALRVAGENARAHRVDIDFIRGDFFAHPSLPHAPYDLIISNPPYIRTDEIDCLQPEVRRQPRIALDGGEDGLRFYRAIIGESPRFFRRGGLLFMEMGCGQGGAIQQMLADSKKFDLMEVIKDYRGIDRIIVAKSV